MQNSFIIFSPQQQECKPQKYLPLQFFSSQTMQIIYHSGLKSNLFIEYTPKKMTSVNVMYFSACLRYKQKSHVPICMAVTSIKILP